jgi:excisionase family DNA binding protein
MLATAAGLQRAGGQRLPDLCDYLTVEEAAEALGYHPNSVRRVIRAGKLPADKKGTIWLIERETLETYKAETEGKAKNDPTRGA